MKPEAVALFAETFANLCNVVANDHEARAPDVLRSLGNVASGFAARLVELAKAERSEAWLVESRLTHLEAMVEKLASRESGNSPPGSVTPPLDGEPARE